MLLCSVSHLNLNNDIKSENIKPQNTDGAKAESFGRSNLTLNINKSAAKINSAIMLVVFISKNVVIPAQDKYAATAIFNICFGEDTFFGFDFCTGIKIILSNKNTL